MKHSHATGHTMPKIFPTYTLLFCFMLFCLPEARPQSVEIRAALGQKDIKPLQIGDTFPEELWHLPLQVVNHPDGRGKITLNDYRDRKLIILDFWATWCAPCIRSLDKLDSIQPLFAGDLQIVPITKQDRDIVTSVLKKRKWRHLSTYGVSDLPKYFPHGTIPHQVWIKEGRILAVTGSTYTETKFIGDVLKGGNPFTFMKTEDLSFDPNIPLFARMADDTAQGQIATFSILTLHRPELPFARE